MTRRVVNFKNTLVILTSNTGAEHVLKAEGDPARADATREKVRAALANKYPNPQPQPQPQP